MAIAFTIIAVLKSYRSLTKTGPEVHKKEIQWRISKTIGVVVCTTFLLVAIPNFILLSLAFQMGIFDSKLRTLLIGVNGVRDRLPLLAALGEGRYLPYHFSCRDFGAKIQKRARKFKKVKKISPLCGENVFLAKVHFIQCLSGRRGGGGRKQLATSSAEARGGGWNTARNTAGYTFDSTSFNQN